MVTLNVAETQVPVDGDGTLQALTFSVNMPQSQTDGESLSTNSVIPFAVQEQHMDQNDPLIGECDQQLAAPQCTHVQVSEQILDDTQSKLVHGSGANEDDWANRARYYVAIGAARETEKDREIEKLNQEKVKLEKELEEKAKKHAQAIKRQTEETEEYQKQVAELKCQLTEKENDLITLQEKCAIEIKEIEDKFNKEIAEKTQEIEKLRETTQAKITELEANLKAKQEEIEKFEEKKKIEIDAIEKKFKEKISKVKNELECVKEAAKLKEELLEYQSRLKWLEEEKKYIAETNELKLKIEALGRRLAEEIAKSASQESEHLKAQLTLHKVQSDAKLKKMEREIKKRDEQLEQCRNKIRRLSLSSTSSSQASLNIGSKNDLTSDDHCQLQPVDEIVKFQLQESPDEFT